ncbi:grpE protein-like protein [Hibiscus syriacus]|uniref:GrpE protein homolog n=1 Tax=Hibiscus syriacus TaxID=106335 RepID=A0A6A3CZA6_HIBSY|nr:protein GrpE-like [Hibiscus syriacus]KAE8733704.1 grpE protein-like protein [Hibiscus syriacus]
MAILLKTPPFKRPPSLSPSLRPTSLNPPKPFNVCFKERFPRTTGVLRFSSTPSIRFVKLVPFANNGGETETTETQQEAQIEDSLDGAISVEEDTNGDESSDFEDAPSSVIPSLLLAYKEALASNDESKVATIEEFLNSIEDEKVDLEKKMSSLSEELSIEKDRILRISADFDNFRKRTERERLSLVSNTKGEVLENLLPVLDNFERAKAQIKVETEGEEKINDSYQSIYKQFMEILGSLGVEPVETVGNHFDPMLHEAIMREDSAEFEEGIILQEFRKGFKLGDRLLRPSMVKVSAGSVAKPEQGDSSEGADADENTKTSETVENNDAESSETTKNDPGSAEAS